MFTLIRYLKSVAYVSPAGAGKKCTDFLLPIVGYQKPVSETGASVNSLILNDPLPRAVLHKALVGIRHT